MANTYSPLQIAGDARTPFIMPDDQHATPAPAGSRSTTVDSLSYNSSHVLPPPSTSISSSRSAPSKAQTSNKKKSKSREKEKRPRTPSDSEDEELDFNLMDAIGEDPEGEGDESIRKKVGRKNNPDTAGQAEFLVEDNGPKVASDPEKRKWYDNGEPISSAQRQKIDSLGSEYEKERAFNMIRNQRLLCELDLVEDVSGLFNPQRNS